MNRWKYTDATNTAVSRHTANGGIESCVVSAISEWIAVGNTPEPADPLPPPVYTCSPWQIRKALNAMSLRQAVEDAVAASTDQVLKDGWEYATEFRSNDPFVISVGTALGKNEQETAELIQYASTL